MSTTTIRVDRATHEELKRLARERHSTVAEALRDAEGPVVAVTDY